MAKDDDLPGESGAVFPFTTATGPEWPGPQPAEADVAIIGGGVIGVMTALHLARVGLRAILLEKGRIAGEQSSRNWGWIRVQGRDPAEIPIAMEAQDQWQALSRETNDALGLRQTGVAYIARTQEALDRYEAWLPHAQAHGTGSRMLSRAGIMEKIPSARADWLGALWTDRDMRAEPWLAVPALARLAARSGAQIVENCAVRGLDLEAGRVAGVITEAGRIKVSGAVVAGGAWSSLFLRRHGVSIPQLSVRCTALATEPLPEVFDGAASDGTIAFRRREDGGYNLAVSGFQELFIGPDAFRAFRTYLPLLKQDIRSTKFRISAPKGYPDGWRTPRNWSMDKASPFEAQRILDPEPNAAKVRDILARFHRRFPDLPKPRLKKAWAGMIDTMPDVVPVVDRVEAIPGLVVATGMSGHGFGIGPAFGRIAADLVQGKAPGHDLSRFRLSRFSDGSPIDVAVDV